MIFNFLLGAACVLNIRCAAEYERHGQKGAALFYGVCAVVCMSSAIIRSFA